MKFKNFTLKLKIDILELQMKSKKKVQIKEAIFFKFSKKGDLKKKSLRNPGLYIISKNSFFR